MNPVLGHEREPPTTTTISNNVGTAYKALRKVQGGRQLQTSSLLKLWQSWFGVASLFGDRQANSKGMLSTKGEK